MITGETLIKGLFYFMLKARGGKYLSRKEIVNKKTGKKSYQYTYANKKGEKPKAPQEQVKQSKPKADSKNMNDNSISSNVHNRIYPILKDHIRSNGEDRKSFESKIEGLKPALSKMGLNDSQASYLIDNLLESDTPPYDIPESEIKKTLDSYISFLELEGQKPVQPKPKPEMPTKKEAKDPISEAYSNISPQNKFPEKRITKSIPEYKNKAKEFITKNKPNSDQANVNGITVIKNPRGGNYELYHKPEGSKTTDIYPLGYTVKNQEEAIAAALALSDLNKK